MIPLISTSEVTALFKGHDKGRPQTFVYVLPPCSHVSEFSDPLPPDVRIFLKSQYHSLMIIF